MSSTTLSYIGDSSYEANIGAGTITCNYDVCFYKYETHIGKKAFIASLH
ncbi:MAG: hypothetical protein U1E36_01295 [Rickettsiales bacterium]